MRQRPVGLLPLLAVMVAGCATLPPQPVANPTRVSQPMVVVDIDGTLTPAVMAVDEVRPAAAEVLTAYVAKGYGLIYLTARNPMAQAGLPDWLRRMGFPPGPLHVAQTSAERDQVARFKAGWLQSYVQRGWQPAWAYGDSSSDFEAYAMAGFTRDQVFALRRRGDADCQPGRYARCLEGWEPHRSFVARLPTVR